MAAANAAGIDQISLFQEIEFTRYVRLVLPADGFVFWINANIITDPAALNTWKLNAVPLDGNAVLGARLPTIKIQGSLHYSTDTRQEQEENYGVNRVVFTAESEVSELNQIAPDEMLLGSFEDIKFAFTSRSSFYQQAGLWHYTGDAVYADMESQIIDLPSQFEQLQVVSNSLPIWLMMNRYVKPDYEAFGNSIPLYPSFLTPQNIRPPFASVHIVPEATRAIASTPTLGRTYEHVQLVTDRVEITLWGVRNDAAMTFVDFVNQFSVNTDLIGMMSMPVMQDEKRTQSELGTIAMKKKIVYEVSYYQNSARSIARQLILEAHATFIIH